MSRLTPSAYLSALEAESARFRTTLADCDPAARVPSCPAWTAADLLGHLTEVQAFWAAAVEGRPEQPEEREQDARPAAALADGLAAFDAAHARLAAALRDADPDDRAWTWSPEHQHVGFILRRQAHEALVHRVDAELAAGRRSPLDPALAADGVDEVLDVMYGGCPPWGTFAPLPHHVRVDLTDTGDSVWVQLGRFSGTDPAGTEYREDDLHVVEDPGTDPDAVVSGTAEDVLLRLWRRHDGSTLEVTGDRAMVDHFRAAVHHPID